MEIKNKYINIWFSKSILHQNIKQLVKSIAQCLTQYLTWMDICIQLGLYPRLSMAI